MSESLASPPRSLMTVLLLAMGVGPLLNYGLSATSDVLLVRLGLTETHFGLLATVLFISAAIVSLLMGKLADVLSIRDQLILNYGGSALALIVAGFAPNYAWLFIAVILGGTTQVIANPTTNRVISQWVPQKARPSWIGVKQSGVQATQLLAGLYFPAMTLWLGWPAAACGAAGFVLVMLWYSIAQLPPEQSTHWAAVGRALLYRPVIPKNPVPGGAQKQRLPAGVWLLAGVALLGGIGMQATNLYLPLYAVRSLDFSLVLGGLTAGVAGVVGVVSRIWWGKALGRGKAPASLLMATTGGGILGIGLVMLAGLVQAPWLLWCGVVLYGVTVLGTNVIVNATTLMMVSPQRIGAASGLTTMGMYCGFAAGPTIAALLFGATGSYTASWAAVMVAYACCFLLALALIPHTRGIQSRSERASERASEQASDRSINRASDRANRREGIEE